MVFLEKLLAICHGRIGFVHARVFLYFGKMSLQVRANTGSASRPPCSQLPFVVAVELKPENMVFSGLHLIVTQFVQNILRNEETTGHADCQAQDIDHRKDLVLENVAECRFEVVA